MSFFHCEGPFWMDVEVFCSYHSMVELRYARLDLGGTCVNMRTFAARRVV